MKFRFIEFEMDGNDATLQNAIQQITQAVGRPHVIVKPAPAALAGPVTKGNGAAEKDTADVHDAELLADDQQDQDVNDTSQAGEDRPRRVRRFKSPKIVDVELRGGEMPLKQFLTALAPDSDQKRYMLIAYWFKTHRNLDEVTPDHIFTGYREAGWTTFPKEPSKPLRNMTTLGWFQKGQAGSAYSLNHIGEGKAMEMVQKANIAT